MKSLTINVTDSELSRLCGPLRHLVEVDRAVVGEESDLRPTVSGQLVQFVQERVAEDFDVTGLDGLAGHVQQEDVDRRLGRPQHVLRGSNELDGGRLKTKLKKHKTVTFFVEFLFFRENAQNGTKSLISRKMIN